MAARAYRHQHLAPAPRGWRVRSKRAGEHVVRVAFPPGPRRRGVGKVLEILHPKKNPACENGECAIAQNPAEELLIFGNPSRRRNVEMPKSPSERRAYLETLGRDDLLKLLRSVRISAHKIESTRGLVDLIMRRTGPPHLRERNAEGPTLYDAIRHGSRVTIVDRFGKQRTGRAVMRGPAGWVLNMGGPHGTPGIAHPDNVTRVKNPRRQNFQEEIKKGSRVAIISANEPEGPYTIRLYVNDGETATLNVKKAKTISGARAMGREMIGDEVRDPRSRNAAGGIGNHKPGCKCAFCERARDVRKMVEKMPVPVRGVFDRNPSPAEAVKLYRRMTQLLEQGKIKASNRLRMRLAQINKKMGWSMADVAERARGINPRGRKSSQHRRRPGPSLRRHRNPSEVKQAVSLFQTFHGRDPKEIAEKQESAAMRLEYTALGDLSYLIVQPPSGRPVQINFEGDGVKLASAPNGRQLYAIGGNQNLSSLLDKFTDDPEKDFIDLGDGLEVQYEARKIHSNFAPTDWYHKFGEKNGALPRLMYDKLKKRIFFIGGEYFIDTSDAVSPGIEN